MKYYPHPILAKEGWPFIIISVLITTLADGKDVQPSELVTVKL